MENFIGNWIARKDVQTRMGISAFTLPEGSRVSITQQDAVHKKVLVSCGPRTIDWMPVEFLAAFDRAP